MLTFLLLAVCCSAQSQQPLIFHDASNGAVIGPFDGSFDKLVVEAMDKYHVPGLSIAVVNKSLAIGKVWQPGRHH